MRKFLLILIIFLTLMLILFVGAVEYSIPVSVTVLPSTNFTIDVNITVTQEQIKAGESVPVFTELAKIKENIEDPEEKIVVDLFYKVMRKAELITTLSTTMEVIDYNADTILIPIPKDAIRNIYTVEVTATYLDKIDRDKDAFYVTTTFFRTFLNFLGIK